ncbi:MAG TPA: hypothetical protein VM901_08015 [Bdellovibrionota bacterium]|jgi:hypothetical protein|nr:hypothetical protein [Bdellovibrionota bacterium]
MKSLSSLLLAASVFAVPAMAETVQASFLTGFPLALVDLDGGIRGNLNAKALIGGEVTLHLKDYPFAVGVYYEGYFGGDYGMLPLNNSGIMLHYYPFGSLNNNTNIGNKVSVRQTGLTMYGTFAAGLTFMNIRSQKATDTQHFFGASAFNMKLAANLDYPVDDRFVMGGSLYYLTTFGGKAGPDNEDVGIPLSFAFVMRSSWLFF